MKQLRKPILTILPLGRNRIEPTYNGPLRNTSSGFRIRLEGPFMSDTTPNGILVSLQTQNITMQKLTRANSYQNKPMENL